jgi:hypothetical protein
MFHPHVSMQLQLFFKLLNIELNNKRNDIEKNEI